MKTFEPVPSKSRPVITTLAVVTTLVCIGCQRGAPGSESGTAATPTPAASTPAEASAEAPSDTAIATMLQPWKGDLDGMVERRYIRMLVTFSKTNYFLDGAKQYGATYDGGKHFEDFLNKRLGT
jgi:hypothetical protein